MSYCRWGEGDLYAYSAANDYVVMVAARCVNEQVKKIYHEPTAHALLARMVWLKSKGCDFPWDAYRFLMEDIVAEVEENEKAST